MLTTIASRIALASFPSGVSLRSKRLAATRTARASIAAEQHQRVERP